MCPNLHERGTRRAFELKKAQIGQASALLRLHGQQMIVMAGDV